MAVANCSRCLLRSSIALPFRVIQPIASSTAHFSTTSAANKSGLNQKKATKSDFVREKAVTRLAGGHIRAGKHTIGSKAKKKREHARSGTAPGERKAFRKRIQLSNDNALLVSGLEQLSKDNIGDTASAGRVMAVPDAVVDQLRAVEAFKATQTWGLFRQPSLLVRPQMIELTKKMEEAVEKKETLRLVIDGDRIAGKSTALLEAMAVGFMKDWIVIHIPEGQELTTACTDYSRIPRSESTLWQQPAYAMKLLQNILKASEPVLNNLKTTMEHENLPVRVPIGSSLTALIAAAREADYGYVTFKALWEELTNPDVPRPPIMFTLDGLSHVMRVSDYRDPDYKLIHAHDFTLIRLFADALSDTIKLPHGGAVLAATTKGNNLKAPSVDLALAQRRAEQLKQPVPEGDPWNPHYDERVEASLKTVEVMDLKALSKTEARSLMEYWAASGVYRNRVDERTVTEGWTMGGGGIVGEMERASLLTMRL